MAYTLIRKVPTIITRPNDTVPYLAGDVVADVTTTPSGIITFANASGTSGVSYFKLVDLQLSVLGAAVQAQYRLQLFSATPSNASRVGDNVPWPIISADKLLYLGFVDLPPTNNGLAGSDSSFAQKKDFSYPVVSEAATGNVYGVLLTMSPYTPTALQTHQLSAGFENY